MIYVLGATSMPGWSLIRNPEGRNLVPFCSTHAKFSACEKWRRLDLENPDSYARLFKDFPPRVVVHCGGVCDVEKCEENPDWAKKINVESLAHLLKHLPAVTRLVYVSSDHVFGGGEAPYTEQVVPAPISVYGRTRVEAENLVLSARPDALILRYALGIGPSVDGRSGHLDWLQYRRRKNLPITVVQDEFRSAVWTGDLAKRILEFADSDIAGLRHITATKPVSRVEPAHFLNRRFNIGANLDVALRRDRSVPHLGRVELATVYDDPLARPLPSVV